MLELRDEKVIRKYVLLPLVARDCFLSAVILVAASFLLNAADAVFFYRRDAYHWYEAEDGVVVSTDYCTDPQEEYGQYDSAYIRISVSVPDAWE